MRRFYLLALAVIALACLDPVDMIEAQKIMAEPVVWPP